MNWIQIKENDINTYPKEGYNVIVSNGVNVDVAYYSMSDEYKWMKINVKNDDVSEFTDYNVTKWKYIDEDKSVNEIYNLSLDEYISKFKDGNTKFPVNPIFNSIIHQLHQGVTTFSIIDQLLEIIDNQQKAINKCL